MENHLNYIDFFLIQIIMIWNLFRDNYTVKIQINHVLHYIKSESKHLNLKSIQFFLTWFKVPMKLIPVKLKWSIAIICYNTVVRIRFKCVDVKILPNFGNCFRKFQEGFWQLHSGIMFLKEILGLFVVRNLENHLNHIDFFLIQIIFKSI